MAYLAYLKLSAAESSFCDISTTVSCSSVNQSIYSAFLGIPVSILGFLYFAAVGGMVLTGFGGAALYPVVLLISIASLIFSLYLSYAELFVLKTICVFCESSKVLMLLIGGLAFWKSRKLGAKIKSSWLIGAILVGVLGIAVSYFNQPGLGPKKDYTEFAQ